MEIVVVAGDFNVDIGSSPEDYKAQHGGFDYGIRNKELKDS